MTEHNPVSFDQEAFRAWLAAPCDPSAEGSPSNIDANPVLATAYLRSEGEAGWLAVQAYDAIRHAAQVWTFAPGVSDLRLWPTAAAEGGNDGVTGEIDVDGVKLSIGQLDDGELVTDEQTVLPGYEAAELALTAVAGQVNGAVTAFQKSLGDLIALPGRYAGLSAATVAEALDHLGALYDDWPNNSLDGRQVQVVEQITSMWRRGGGRGGRRRGRRGGGGGRGGRRGGGGAG